MAADHITWAGRTLSGHDRFGDWTTEVPNTWWGSPDTKGETVDRANADGEYDLPVYNAARILTFDGLLHAKSHMDMHEAGDFLTGPMRGRLQVAGHGNTKWADAVRSSSTLFEPITDTLARWQVHLRFPDPRKFGDLHTFPVSAGAPATVFHRGNYNASPVVQINGPVTGGFTITHPGGLYTAVGDLAAGSTIRIDFNTGRLRLNGNDRSDLVTRADLYKVPPGNTAAFSVNRGVGFVELIDTYI